MTLLELAEKRNAKDWDIFSYMVATGSRTSEIAEKFQTSPKRIAGKLKRYSGLIGFTIRPHDLRIFYYRRLHSLGISPRVIQFLIGHTIIPPLFPTVKVSYAKG
jgi:hypothetical protein